MTRGVWGPAHYEAAERRRVHRIPPLLKRQENGFPLGIQFDTSRGNRWKIEVMRKGKRHTFRTRTIEDATTLVMRCYFTDVEIIHAAESIKAEHESYPIDSDNQQDEEEE